MEMFIARAIVNWIVSHFYPLHFLDLCNHDLFSFFNRDLEPFPITISDNDLKETVHEFYKSVQYMTNDSRRVYSSLEQAKSVIMNSNGNDYYYKPQPNYKNKLVRCTDCERVLPFKGKPGDDIREYRCPNCYHKGGSNSAGRLKHMKPSKSYHRKVISEQMKTLDRHSAGVYHIFELIRNNYISIDQSTQEKYKLTFDECFSDFLKGNGPPDFKLAVKHYVSSKRNNRPCYIKSPCYIQTQDDLMNMRVLDPGYLNAISEIYLNHIQGFQVSQKFVSIAERKLIDLNLPLTLISAKISKDLAVIDTLVPNGINETMDKLTKTVRNTMSDDNPINTLISEAQGYECDKKKLLFILITSSFF
jgi:hypothetical protein